MHRPHRHNELEINFLPHCSVTYLICNRRYKVKKGSVVAFWGLMPHQVVDFNKDCPYYAITIPFTMLQEWKLRKEFLETMFRGEVQILLGLDDVEVEKKRFQRWSEELQQMNSEIYAACLMEICAYVMRIAIRSLPARIKSQEKHRPPINLVERMVMYIARNFTDTISASDVARKVDLHPDYANTIFKRVFCSSLASYINTQRILYAESKLVISDESITSVAYQSGFNSISRFNAVFKKKNNLTPREYRKLKRQVT